MLSIVNRYTLLYLRQHGVLHPFCDMVTMTTHSARANSYPRATDNAKPAGVCIAASSAATTHESSLCLFV
jgi:hypothetical protein